MDDGRRPGNKKEQPKPTWTERAVPEVVKPLSPTQPLIPNEHGDALVPAADPIVQAAYGRTGILPVRPVMNRGDGGTDALVIQKGARQTRVLNFQVEGIHWRAGFAPEIGHTPLGQYVPALIPPEQEVQAGNGFIMRPVENELEMVLRDIVPLALLKLGEDMFGKHRDLGQTYLYYIPHPTGASVGIVAWYLLGPQGKAHILYLQTDVKKADPRILDEMHKTFRASLVARQQHGVPARPFDFWEEVQDATTQVESSLKNSAFARNSFGMRGFMTDAREQAENRVYNQVMLAIDKLTDFAKIAFIRVPQLLLATAVRYSSLAIVRVINLADRLVAPKREDEP